MMTVPSAPLSNLLYTAEHGKSVDRLQCCFPSLLLSCFFPSTLKDVFALFQRLSFLASILFTNLSHFFMSCSGGQKHWGFCLGLISLHTESVCVFVCVCISMFVYARFYDRGILKPKCILLTAFHPLVGPTVQTKSPKHVQLHRTTQKEQSVSRSAEIFCHSLVKKTEARDFVDWNMNSCCP